MNIDITVALELFAALIFFSIMSFFVWIIGDPEKRWPLAKKALKIE